VNHLVALLAFPLLAITIQGYADDVADYSQAGIAAQQKGDCDTAIEMFTKALEAGLSGKQVSAIYIYRGACYFSKELNDEAVADYDMALRLEPDNKIALNDRGNAYNREGEYHSAIADYSAALKLDPLYKSPYVNRGVAYLGMNLLNKAKADFDRALDFDPKNAIALTNRARLYIRTRSYVQAIGDLDQAIIVSPESPEPYANRARVLFIIGKFVDSASDFAHASKLSSKNLSYLLWQYLAVRRSGKDESEQVREGFSSTEEWPAVVMKFFLGKATRQEVLEAANDEDSKKEAGNVCEALTFMGEYALLNHDLKSAKHLFDRAGLRCTLSGSYIDIVTAEASKLKR
jgi:tetratricopeptide (TPR) repeat protein